MAKSWQEDLLQELDAELSPQGVFGRIEAAAAALGFNFCAYGLRASYPLSNPRAIVFNNYPAEWQARYEQMDYFSIDPTVRHARRSRAPVIWSDELFASAPDLWKEAQSHGLRVGWTQSVIDTNGTVGMLTLARSSNPLEETELRAIEMRMSWLAHAAHSAMVRVLGHRLGMQQKNCLTEREIEVLKWTADGKTAWEISEILAISDHTVNFHVKNAITKLGVTNKTAAAVQAVVLGMLS